MLFYYLVHWLHWLPECVASHAVYMLFREMHWVSRLGVVDEVECFRYQGIGPSWWVLQVSKIRKLKGHDSVIVAEALLRHEGVDEAIAQHISHLFTRDPLVLWLLQCCCLGGATTCGNCSRFLMLCSKVKPVLLRLWPVSQWQRFHIDAVKFLGQSTIELPRNGVICCFKN